MDLTVLRLAQELDFDMDGLVSATAYSALKILRVGWDLQEQEKVQWWGVGWGAVEKADVTGTTTLLEQTHTDHRFQPLLRKM